MSNTSAQRQILAASFATRDGAAKAAASILGAYPGRIVNTAVVRVSSSGEPSFVESKDWGPGRGALVGAAIGLIGGPFGVLAGGGLGALASRLRDMGFDDGELRRLGESLASDDSAVIFEISSEVVHKAAALLATLTPLHIVTEDVTVDVARLFDGAEYVAPSSAA